MGRLKGETGESPVLSRNCKESSGQKTEVSSQFHNWRLASDD
jgi:hypothetical protein